MMTPLNTTAAQIAESIRWRCHSLDDFDDIEARTVITEHLSTFLTEFLDAVETREQSLIWREDWSDAPRHMREIATRETISEWLGISDGDTTHYDDVGTDS